MPLISWLTLRVMAQVATKHSCQISAPAKHLLVFPGLTYATIIAQSSSWMLRIIPALVHNRKATAIVVITRNASDTLERVRSDSTTATRSILLAVLLDRKRIAAEGRRERRHEIEQTGTYYLLRLHTGSRIVDRTNSNDVESSCQMHSVVRDATAGCYQSIHEVRTSLSSAGKRTSFDDSFHSR